MPHRDAQKPRRRPVQSRSRATVEIILEAAAHILEARGVGGLNTNAVAERAGVGIGSLYQYFPNKEALTAALVDRSGERLRLALAAAIDRGVRLPFRDGLTLVVRAAVVHQLSRPALEHILDEEERRRSAGTAETENLGLIAEEMVRFLDAHRAVVTASDLTRAAADALAVGRALIDLGASRGDDAAMIEATVVKAIAAFLLS